MIPEAHDDLGLNIDMLDADRLRSWSNLIDIHGADLTHWCQVAFVVKELSRIADDLEAEVRDVGKLRSELASKDRYLAALRQEHERLKAELEAERKEREAAQRQCADAERFANSLEQKQSHGLLGCTASGNATTELHDETPR